MRRDIRKQVKLNRREAATLTSKAERAGMTECSLIRALINEYEPAEKPDDRFYEFTGQLNDIADNLQRIADVASITKNINTAEYEAEVTRLHFFTAGVEEILLKWRESDEWKEDLIDGGD